LLVVKRCTKVQEAARVGLAGVLLGLLVGPAACRQSSTAVASQPPQGSAPGETPGTSAAAPAASPSPSPSPAAAGSASPLAGPAPRVARVRLLERFDAGEVSYEGPEPRAAVGALSGHFRRMVHPYASGKLGLLRQDVALYDPDLRAAARGRQPQGPGAAPPPLAGGGLPAAPGASTRGVYAMRQTLVLLAPARLTFEVQVPREARLTAGLALLPPGRGGAPVIAEVLAQGPADARPRVVHSRTLGKTDVRRWLDLDADLAAFAGQKVKLTVAARTEEVGASKPGPPLGTLLVAHPEVVGPAERPDEAPYNVVLLVVDSLRPDAIGAYGGPAGLTPVMDALAQQSTRFNQAFSASTWTRPAVIALLTGQHQAAFGLRQVWAPPPDEKRRFYGQRPPLISRRLSPRGYATAAVGNNFFFLGYSPIAVDLGFQRTTDIRDYVLDTPAIARTAVDFIEENKDRRFLLYVHLDTPHWPYLPPAEFAERARKLAPKGTHPEVVRYLGDVAYGDAAVGQILAALSKHKLDERTLLVVTADHGEGLDASHDHYLPTVSKWLRFGHGFAAYDETLRVPLLVRLPGRFPAGQAVDTQVRHLDLAPTVAELMGLPPDPRLAGESLLPLVSAGKSAAPPGERPVYVEGRFVRAYRAGGWKYIYREPGGRSYKLRDGRTVSTLDELYDITKDPGETRDIKAQHPEVLARMREAYKAADQKAHAPVAAAGAPGSTQTLKMAPPDPALLRLRLSSDGGPHRLEGKISGAGPVRLVKLVGPGGATGGQAVAEGDAVRFTLEAKGESEAGLDLQLVEGESQLKLELLLDGKPVPASALLVGGYGLALLPSATQLGPDGLARLEAARAPAYHPGSELGLFLWRDRGARAGVAAGGPPVEDTTIHPRAAKEVEDALRDWGYVAPGSKK
jgi:arylsulfatase A-like enzyme